MFTYHPHLLEAGGVDRRDELRRGAGVSHPRRKVLRRRHRREQ